MSLTLNRPDAAPGIPDSALAGTTTAAPVPPVPDALPVTVGEFADDMVRRADAARDTKRYRQAAFLYAEAVRLMPTRGDLHVQCGHMLKEAGELEAAEEQYLAAAELMPGDADLALQLGHYYKSAGRIAEAVAAYRRSLALHPGWAVPKQEIEALQQAGWRMPGEAEGAFPDTPLHDPLGGDALSGEAAVRSLAAAARGTTVVADLAPRPILEMMHRHGEGIEFKRIGRQERTYWGRLPVLRGVEAFRGFCVAGDPVLQVELMLNDRLIYRGGVRGGYELPRESEDRRLRKYVFNVWIDLSGFVHGRYEFSCRATSLTGRTWTRHERVVIAPPPPPSLLPDSDGFVAPADPEDPRPLERQVNARPSMVRQAGRPLLREPPRTVLVQRTDALGDMVVSVPALRRLRQLFPQSRIVGLVSNANRELAETLGLFDEMVVIDFPTSEWERRRVMPVEAQRELAERLKPYEFDLAIDLGELPSSRLLLPLSGAPVLVGFHADVMPALDVQFRPNTYDKWNDREITPHTNKALGLIEWLATLLRAEPNLAIRQDLDRTRLTSAFGLPVDARFAVLHAGARWRFSRWPHYFGLAEMLLARTDLHVVMLTNDPGEEDRVPEALAGSDRFQLLHRRLGFDDFDALVSFCTAFVGDDSGPKHLASLRGANVVSVQSARNNWVEWGQDTSGCIVTRRVPCAGCLIQDDLEAQECGKDIVCLTAITPDEVFAAVEGLIRAAR